MSQSHIDDTPEESGNAKADETESPVNTAESVAHQETGHEADGAINIDSTSTHNVDETGKGRNTDAAPTEDTEPPADSKHSAHAATNVEKPDRETQKTHISETRPGGEAAIQDAERKTGDEKENNKAVEGEEGSVRDRKSEGKPESGEDQQRIRDTDTLDEQEGRKGTPEVKEIGTKDEGERAEEIEGVEDGRLEETEETPVDGKLGKTRPAEKGEETKPVKVSEKSEVTEVVGEGREADEAESLEVDDGVETMSSLNLSEQFAVEAVQDDENALEKKEGDSAVEKEPLKQKQAAEGNKVSRTVKSVSIDDTKQETVTSKPVKIERVTEAVEGVVKEEKMTGRKTDESKESAPPAEKMSDAALPITSEKEIKFKIRGEDSVLDLDIGDFFVRHGSSSSTVNISLETLSSSEQIAHLHAAEPPTTEDDEGTEGEEVEEEVLNERQEKVVIDRLAVTKQYRMLLIRKRTLTKRSGILTRLLIDFLKQRKNEATYSKIEEPTPDMTVKFRRRLDVYGEMSGIEQKQRNSINADTQSLKERRDALVQESVKAFKKLRAAEYDAGANLINTTTGLPLPSTVVSALIHRQERLAKELAVVRLQYILLRNNVSAHEAALKKLETIGDGLQLLDYEQLRVENQNYAEKLEEREDELERLREKTTASIQSVAHMKEKYSATLMEIDELAEQLEDMEDRVSQAREHLSKVKRKRDTIRMETTRLRRESGLLAQPKLLPHFEQSIVEYTRLEAELRELKAAFSESKDLLREMRKRVDSYGQRNASIPCIQPKDINVATVLRSRLPSGGLQTKPGSSRDNIELRQNSLSSRVPGSKRRSCNTTKNDSFYDVPRVHTGRRPSYLPRRLSSTNNSAREFGDQEFRLFTDITNKRDSTFH